MHSWKARLLTLLTIMAMLLAVSVPVVAQTDDGFVGDDSGDDCETFGDLDGFFSDGDLDGIDDDCDFADDSESLDTIDVGDLECLLDEDGENVLFCVDEEGEIVYS